MLLDSLEDSFELLNDGNDNKYVKLLENMINKSLNNAENYGINFVYDYVFFPNQLKDFKYRDKIDIIFLANLDANESNIIEDLKNYSKSFDWPSFASKEELERNAKYILRTNKILINECNVYGFKLINTSRGKKRNIILNEVFKEIDEKSLYKFYKDIIFDSKFIVTVVGDFEEELILKNINKITKYLSNKNYELSELNLNEIETNKVNEVVEQKKLNQSTLLVGYKFYNLTDFERNYVLQIYNLILGTMNNSILFVNVREKKSLCYSISSYIHKYVPSITIEAGINSNNYDKTIKEIKSCVKLMKNKDEINKLFTNALNTINLTLNDYYEDVNKIVNHYVMKEINNIVSIEEMRENYNKVTVEDIVNLNKKIELNTIYFLEGTNDKKN